jgi:hypothetical protein
MDESAKGWGFIILIFLLFIVFGGNAGGLFNRGPAGFVDAEVLNSRYDELKNASQTQRLIEQTAGQNFVAINNMQNAIGSKIDYYSYMDLRDKVSDLQAKNMQLESQLYSNAQFGALNARLDRIDCMMIKRPPFFGTGVLPDGTVYPSGTGAATTGA